MKSYNSITTKINSEISIYAFDKLDGSNIRSEWIKSDAWLTKLKEYCDGDINEFNKLK
jgi:hypothetical protein